MLSKRRHFSLTRFLDYGELSESFIKSFYTTILAFYLLTIIGLFTLKPSLTTAGMLAARAIALIALCVLSLICIKFATLSRSKRPRKGLERPIKPVLIALLSLVVAIYALSVLI
jgi:hypothetical protein